MFGMPGVSMTLSPILNCSTVIISYVVPGSADSVSNKGSSDGLPDFFWCCFFSMALIKEDLPEFVVPIT